MLRIGKRVVGLVTTRKAFSTNADRPAGKGPSQMLIVLAVGGVVGFGMTAILNNRPKQAVPEPNHDDLADLQAAVTDRVFFDVSFDDAPVEQSDRIVIGLYGGVCPDTVENFRAICEGGQKSLVSGKRLSYENCIFHRIIPGFMLQSGDVTVGDGTGGESIFGYRFRDESFQLKHTGVGVVSMANKGANSNSSQFFLCVAPAPWLDGRHVVFGQVLHGLPALRKIESRGNVKGAVSGTVRIVKCGVLPKLHESLAVQEDKGEVLDETGRNAARIMK